MRYILVTLFACTIAMPSFANLSFAMTVAGVSTSFSKEPLLQVARHNRSHARAPRRSRGDGGIHPLVGSGEY
jgi:hypothetical protein